MMVMVVPASMMIDVNGDDDNDGGDGGDGDGGGFAKLQCAHNSREPSWMQQWSMVAVRAIITAITMMIIIIMTMRPAVWTTIELISTRKRTAI